MRDAAVVAAAAVVAVAVVVAVACFNTGLPLLLSAVAVAVADDAAVAAPVAVVAVNPLRHSSNLPCDFACDCEQFENMTSNT